MQYGFRGNETLYNHTFIVLLIVFGVLYSYGVVNGCKCNFSTKVSQSCRYLLLRSNDSVCYIYYKANSHAIGYYGNINLCIWNVGLFYYALEHEKGST